MTPFRFRARATRKEVHLSVTPLIDVLFLFIIFFTLTSTFRRAGELELSLPESTTSTPAPGEESPETVEIVATEDGRLSFQGDDVTMRDLGRRLREARAEDPGRHVSIRAEEGVRHGEVVRLLDAVRTAGFVGVGIGTDRAIADADAAGEGVSGRPGPGAE